MCQFNLKEKDPTDFRCAVLLPTLFQFTYKPLPVLVQRVRVPIRLIYICVCARVMCARVCVCAYRTSVCEVINIIGTPVSDRDSDNDRFIYDTLLY